MALNAKQRLFVKEYIKSGNATQAAKVAGYSPKSAKTVGPRMLENVGVKAAIARSLDKATEKAELNAAAVLANIRKLAEVNLTKAFAEDGTMLPLHEMPEDVQFALVSIESDDLIVGSYTKKKKIGKTRKLKIADKVRALEMLAKHFKLLTDVQEVTGKDGGPQVILTMAANDSEAVLDTGKDEDGCGAN